MRGRSSESVIENRFFSHLGGPDKSKRQSSQKERAAFLRELVDTDYLQERLRGMDSKTIEDFIDYLSKSDLVESPNFEKALQLAHGSKDQKQRDFFLDSILGAVNLELNLYKAEKMREN